MKVTQVKYERLVNLGDYNNHKAGVEVALDEGEDPLEAMKRAKQFVNAQVKKPASSYERSRYQQVVSNSDDHTPRQLKEAQDWLKANPDEIDIPF